MWGRVLLVLETVYAPQRLIWPKMSLVPRLRNTNPGLGDLAQ